MDPVVTSFDGTQTPSMTGNFAPAFTQVHLYNRSSGVSTDEITLATTYKAALHLEQNLTADFSAAITLPVRWAFFTATCNTPYTLLKWGTAAENNNSHFIVEKSMDAVSWFDVGQVPGIGNSGVEQQYEFQDSTRSTARFYRLRQVDRDGKSEFSKIVAIDCEPVTGDKIRLFPNPAHDIIQFTGAEAGRRYTLINAQGRRVKTGLTLNGNTIITLTELPTGSYYLRVEGYDAGPFRIMKVSR